MFRKEVIEANRAKLLGTVHLAESIAYPFLRLFCTGVACCVVLLLFFGRYTQYAALSAQLIVKKNVFSLPAYSTKVFTLLSLQREQHAQVNMSLQTVALLKEGERVMLHYAAYPYQKFGFQYGQIVEIQPVLNHLSSPHLYFKMIEFTVVIRLEKQYLERGNKISLLEDKMPLKIMLPIKKWTLLEWFFKRVCF